jgi:lipid kinase YegS
MHARLILNGKKADRSDVRDAVRVVRNEGHDLDVRVTWERGDASRLVVDAARDGVPRVIAGGGDGSVNEMANGLMAVDEARRPSMGILPLGTANDFATSCRVPADVIEALRLAVMGKPRPVDLGRCNDAYFANIASGGFGAAVTADTPVELKNFLGGGAYTIMGVVKAVNFRPYDCTIHTPSGFTTGAMVVGAVCNGRQAGGGQPLAPDAMIDDGLLDVVFLRPFPVGSAAQVAAEIASRRDGGEYVVRMRVPWVEVSAGGRIPVNLDGEPVEGELLHFSCVPACIAMVLPDGCPCLRG